MKVKGLLLALLVLTQCAWDFPQGWENNFPFKRDTDGSISSNPSNRNVGIGSSAPGAKLDVNGTIRSTSGGFTFPDGTTQTTAGSGGSGSNYWNLSTGNQGINTTNNVGIGSVNPLGRLDIGNAHVHFVGCSDSLSAAISAATVGDTLQLGSCTYSISVGLTIDKAINFVGISPTSTIIDTGASDITALTVTADNVNLANFRVTGTNDNQTNGSIDVSCRTGTVCQNINIESVKVDRSQNTALAIYGIAFDDAGGSIKNSIVQLTNAGAGRPIAYSKTVKASAEATSTLRISNCVAEVTSTNATYTGQARGYFHWNDAADTSAFDSSLYIYNSSARCRINWAAGAGMTGDTECLQNQGPLVAPNPGVTGGIYTYVYDTAIDGSDPDGNCAASQCRDARIEDYAITTFYGGTMGRGYITTANNGTVYKYGANYAGSIEGQLPKQAAQINAQPAINITGQEGGDKPTTGTQAGLVGGPFTLTGGLGGVATGATVTGTGGKGGGFTLTSGAGGTQTTATSTTNVGGAGGDIKLVGAVGGNATGAGTTNNGGAGSSLYLVPGAGGTGTTANGNAGNLYLGANSSGIGVGNVSIGTFVSPGSLLTLGNGSAAVDPGLTVEMARNDTSTSSNDVLGTIQATTTDTQLTTQQIFAQIKFLSDANITTDAAQGRIAFYTTESTVAGAPIERMRINGNGGIAVNFNSATPVDNYVFRIRNNGANNLFYVDTATSNIGIGTLAPGSKLSIVNNVSIGASTAGGFALLAAPANGLLVQGNVGIGTSMTGNNSRLSVFGGNVGLGTINPGTVLDVTGDMRNSGVIYNTGITTDATKTDSTVCQDSTTHQFYSGSGTLGICLGTSSERYKNRISDLKEGLDQIISLQPKNFFYNLDAGDHGNRLQYGLIAEDVVKVIPGLVGLDSEGKPNSVDLLGMVPILIKSTKELENEIIDLKNRIEKLENK